MYLQQQETRLVTRQSDGSSGSCNCMSGGTIAGIVIGTIAGTLLILWIIYTTRSSSNNPSVESVVDRKRRRSSNHGSRRGSNSTYSYRDGRAYVAKPTKVYYKPEWRDVLNDGLIGMKMLLFSGKYITTKWAEDGLLRRGGLAFYGHLIHSAWISSRKNLARVCIRL